MIRPSRAAFFSTLARQASHAWFLKIVSSFLGVAGFFENRALARMDARIPLWITFVRIRTSTGFFRTAFRVSRTSTDCCPQKLFGQRPGSVGSLYSDKRRVLLVCLFGQRPGFAGQLYSDKSRVPLDWLLGRMPGLARGVSFTGEKSANFADGRLNRTLTLGCPNAIIRTLS